MTSIDGMATHTSVAQVGHGGDGIRALEGEQHQRYFDENLMLLQYVAQSVEIGNKPLAHLNLGFAIRAGVRAAFIPYTNLTIKWHTDGYFRPLPNPGFVTDFNGNLTAQ